VHTQPDTIRTIGRSQVQFGPLNNRVYLLKLDAADLPGIVHDLEQLAQNHGLSKICAKVPWRARTVFEKNGFVREALIPALFHGREDGVYLAKFLDRKRSISAQMYAQPYGKGQGGRTADKQGWSRTGNDGLIKHARALDLAGIQVQEMGLDRRAEIAQIFAQSFAAYPFPVYDPVYLRECMQTHVLFFGAEAHGRIAALASSEMDKRAGHVEMTDFITLPDFRGQGLAGLLLMAMESKMRSVGLQTAFSIARSESLGINTVFARHGYTYRGRLIQNTCFNGRLEDMNIWSKSLGREVLSL
jgi:putative beta-lysine N-acetyltransferase